MNARRKKAEELIYKIMDLMDKTGMNTSYYKEKFSKMSDVEFQKWAAQPLPIRFHTKPFVVEPSMSDVEAALDELGTPLLEKVALPYLYVNKEGEPVWSKEAMVIYIHIKKMKQFITKKFLLIEQTTWMQNLLHIKLLLLLVNCLRKIFLLRIEILFLRIFLMLS